MARIPEEEIERLKREISLERLAVAKGIQLKKHGENLLGLCPFHDDREPSLVITPSKNLWHCLGACQTGGTVIDWVMRAEGVRFRHAVELLRADLPSLEAFPEKPRGRQKEKVAKQSTTPKLPAVIESRAADDVLLRQVVDYYHETLKQSPEALEYLQKRGLSNAEMIEHFRLGYANRTLYTQVSIRQLKAVHALTHPSAKLERRPAPPGPELAKTASTREELFSLLAAEAEEERLADDGT